MTALFDYHPEVLERFPAIAAGVVHTTGVSNPNSSAELHQQYFAEQAEVISAIGETPLSEIPSVAAWRRAFTSFGVKPTQYRSAIESLMRRLTKKGDIPSISTLVDIGNLVSIRHRLPVAFFDQAEIVGATMVRFADGSESFTDLGSSDTIHPEPGEVIFADEAGVVSARRWCWRQSGQSATGPNTSEVLITVEGHHDTAVDDVAAATRDILALLREHQPRAEISSAALFSVPTGWTPVPA
ncbi:MAG: phenylalanine--tRNA ligase beta subunit-related protein [Acidimicrobiia bacterium]|nr:phenylalanine--tRNA ligase beta subunit-related protein [Acidimicrobiia bacterium]